MTSYLLRWLLVLPAALALAVAPAASQEKKSVLTLEAVRVEPASPGPDTLCRLSVTLRNRGEHPASALELAVKVNGRDLPAYKDRLYLQAIQPGADREIRLFNFWSTETGRPAPKDGTLTVEVTLARASWMRREMGDGAEVWSPLGAVHGLPATKSVSLKLKKE
jgi:hypothetical protein